MGCRIRNDVQGLRNLASAHCTSVASMQWDGRAHDQDHQAWHHCSCFNAGNADCWDEHLAKILFGYRCGIQASTKFSPFMILTGRTSCLRADNYLQALTAVTDDGVDVEVATAQFLQKVELIASIHENVLLNVEQAQKKQRKSYANRKGKHLFEGLVAGETMLKMKKPRKKRALAASWEGPYQFVGHADGKGNFDFEEGCRMCIIEDADGHQWEKSRRDL